MTHGSVKNFGRCHFVRTGFMAAVALWGLGPGLARAEFFYAKWYSGTGLRPTETCPRWTLFNSADVEVPDFNPVRLRLATSSSGEVMNYTQSGPDFSMPFSGPLRIEFRMRYVSGNTTDSARRVASVLFQGPGGAGAKGNILWIGHDDIFLWSADGVVGSRAFVDTDNSYHTYRIEWDLGTNAIAVYRDGSGVPTLTGVAFSRPQWTAEERIVWGHQYFGAQGETRWQTFFHDFVGPYDDDGDSWVPDSCDNCASPVGNPTQDDIDHDGIGNACDANNTLQFSLLSPVDMVVTDPAQDSIGKTFNFIQEGSTYTDNTDVSGDGQADDIVTIPQPLAGQYLIRIYPEDGANPGDQYTLTIRIDGNQLTIPDGYQDAPVSSLPSVYVWNSAGTLCGDINADSRFSAADIIFLVNYVFKGAAGPVVPGHGDTNCDGVTTSADIIRLVNFIFKSSTPPCSRPADYPG